MEKRKIQKIRTEVLGMKNKKGITLIALVITLIVALSIFVFKLIPLVKYMN